MRFLLSVVSFVFLFLASPALALVIEPAQVVDGNLLTADRVVEVRGGVKRDVVAVAGVVRISGNVGGDALLFADRVHITGSVDGNARILARTVMIDGSIGKNVMVFAQTLTLGKDSRVGWDMLTRSRIVKILGTLDGPVDLAATNVTIDGTLRKQLRLTLPARGSADIGSQALLAGDVFFSSPAENFTIDPGARVEGRIEHDPRKGPIRSRAVAGLLMLLGLVVVGAALLMLWPDGILRPAKTLASDPGPTILAALATLVGAAVVLPLLLVTAVGVPLALILFGLVLATLYLGQLISAYVVGQWALQKVGRSLSVAVTLLLGLLLYALTSMLPGVGVLARLSAVLFGFGAIILEARKAVRSKQ